MFSIFVLSLISLAAQSSSINLKHDQSRSTVVSKLGISSDGSAVILSAMGPDTWIWTGTQFRERVTIESPRSTGIVAVSNGGRIALESDGGAVRVSKRLKSGRFESSTIAVCGASSVVDLAILDSFKKVAVLCDRRKPELLQSADGKLTPLGPNVLGRIAIVDLTHTPRVHSGIVLHGSEASNTYAGATLAVSSNEELLSVGLCEVANIVVNWQTGDVSNYPSREHCLPELQFSVDGTKVFGREMMRKTVSSVQVDSGRTNTFSVRRPRRGWDPFTVFVDSQERLMLLDSGAGNLAEVLEADGKELSVQHEVCRTPIGAHAFSRDRRWLVVAGDNTNDIWVHDIESW